MVNCAVFGCKKRSETSNFREHGVSYHKFPRNPLLRKQWVTFCQRSDGWVPTRTSVVCSDHFDPISFQLLPNNRRILIENALPTSLVKDAELSSYNDDGITQSQSTASSEPQVHTADGQQITIVYNPLSLSQQPMPPSLSSASQLKINVALSPHYDGGIRQSQGMASSESQVHTADGQQITTVYNPLPLSQPMPPAPSSSSESLLKIDILKTPRFRKMRKQLKLKNIQIKRLQSRTKYLEKKVKNLQEILKDLSKVIK